MEMIPIERPEDEPTFLKISTDLETDAPYIEWLKATVGGRWVDIVGGLLNVIRENRDGTIYIYDEATDSWEIDVI